MEQHLFEQSPLATLNPASLPCHKVLNYQLNGIGDLPNVKVKSSLLDATVDSVYSSILNYILPIGCVHIDSINHLNEPYSVSDNTENNGYARHQALKIKSTSLSVQRFLKHSDQSSMSAAHRRLEAFKIKQAFTELTEYFKSHERFVLFINRSLANCAQQFAFCFIHRISHGNINNDALSIDGKWQNNDACSFYSNLDKTTFSADKSYKEAHDAAAIFIKWVCYYNSFNGTDIEANELSEYFSSLYRKYIEYYAVTLIGLTPDELPLNTNIRSDFTDSIRRLYEQDPSESQLIAFITKTFINWQLSKSDLSPPCSEFVGPDCASKLILDSVLYSEQQHYTEQSILTRCAIIALRKLLFGHLFKNQLIRQSLLVQLNNRRLDTIAGLSEQYENCAKWLYGSEDSLVHSVIFSNAKLLVYFVPITQSYVVEHFNKGHKYSFLNARELSIYLQGQSKLDFNLPGALVWKNLIKLINILIEIESCQLA